MAVGPSGQLGNSGAKDFLKLQEARDHPLAYLCQGGLNVVDASCAFHSYWAGPAIFHGLPIQRLAHAEFRIDLILRFS